MPVRNLVIVLGDQLNADASAFDGFDPKIDAVWMAEVHKESTKVWTHKARIAVFLSGMRHFHASLAARGIAVHYRELDTHDHESLGNCLGADVARLRPEKLIVTQPGEWSVREELREAADAAGIPLEVRPDRHFLCSLDEFASFAEGRKQLRMEFFYRDMRRKHDVLMDGGKPAGGEWNYDKENRTAFPKAGPGPLAPRPRFTPDRITDDVLALVERRFKKHPGSLENFNWPVTPEHAPEALDDFIENRLTRFGLHQDAMWQDEPFLHHSLLAVALNLKLLDPREAIRRTEEAWRGDPDRYPLPSVEGFIRQILGWREYVRGIYWLHMPGYIERNELGASEELPDFYWTGDTEMNCLRQAIGQTLEHGYAHHIQRLMVTGLYAMLLGVDPRRVHEWYLAVYVDAVEWVELPNTLGMSQYADGGIMASKPYAASGKYIDRMSNYCKSCRFDPAEAEGEDACPFTRLYWDFLARNREKLAANPRMKFQMKNLERRKAASPL